MKRKTGMWLLAVGLAVSIRAAQVYSVPEGERIYPGYVVEVDGEKVPVSEVRCSAMPFNRRWPGHQRQVEQTELCGMARFAFAGKATVSVTAAKDFKTVKIRPLARNVAFHRKGRTVTFDISRPGGYSVEFDGYHNNLHVFADAKESDGPCGAKPASPGLYFGPGTHDIGIRRLKSGDTVHLDPGAVVYGCFHASNATDIAILGRGIIDMSRIKEEILFPATGDGREAVKNAKREHMLEFKNCRNVKIDGVVLRDSLVYNIAMWGCEDVAISNVKIIGQWRFNTDGIDLHNCRRARVTDCFARTFDDTFCFKAHEGYGNCEDCTFERCVAWNDWGKAFEVGVECRAEHLRRLTFRDCDCIHAVSWAMDVSNVDYGRVSDVLFDNIRVEMDVPMPRPQMQKTDESPFDATKGLDASPFLFQTLVSFHHEYSRENGGTWTGGGFIDGVTVRNVRVTTDGRKPSVKCGAIDERHRPENIVFEDMAINDRPVSDAQSVELEVGKDAVAPKFVLSDAGRMGATEMNPGSTLGCHERAAGGTFKVLIYGNSIALHGYAPQIGWHGEWGMAASAREKDFAHLVVADLEAKRGERADFRIRNLALLERNYRTNLTHFADLASDVAYAPDYVVIAIGENVPALAEKDMPDYTRFLVALTQPLVASAKHPPVVMRSPFWKNAAKATCTAKAAAEVGAIYVDAGFLGDREENLALGLFEHKGVARHPGDLGMRRLADLILSGLDDRLTLAARGCPPGYTIVLPGAPSPSQAFAATELQKYIGQMTGVTLPIATNVAPARGIFLGNGAPELGNDGFRLVSQPPHFRIEGSGVHGTLFGVYDFLERYCGCEWLAPNCEVVPPHEKVEVPAMLNDVQKPAFTLRDQNWTDHLRNVGFAAKLKLNGFRIEYSAELGGRDHAKDTTTGGAIFDSLCPPRKYFKDHPDWFAVIDGKRRETRAQRCLTNTGFLDFLVAQMKERLRKNYPRCKYYSIYPNDFKHNCQCADCKALDDREGSPSASLVHMANYVAERVCKDYPDVRILTFAYMYTLKPPKTMKVHPNVMICYCTDACDFSKPIRESRWKGCREFVENFRKWKALTDKIYIWDYSANFKYLFQPFECCHVMPENFRYFREMGVFGVFEEGDHYGVKCVDEALKTWVIGHLLWNPDQPLEPLLDRFFRGYYGAAADVARGYYEALVEQEQKRNEAETPLIMWGMKLDDPYQPIEFFNAWSAKWTAALEKVKDDPIRRENVYWARHNVDLVRLVRSKAGAKYSLATCVSDELKREGAALKPVAERVLADFARVKGLNKFRDSELVRRRVEALAQSNWSEQDRHNARIVMSVADLRVDDRPAVKRVDDPLAAGGKAVRVGASAIGEMHHCLALSEESFLKDPGVKIGVRVHARVERTGVATGSVFSVGTCDIVTYRKRDIRNFHVDVAKVAGDGYAWYDVEGTWTPAGNEVLWLSNGKRVNGENPCIKAVYFDQIELYRKDAAEWIAGAHVPPAESNTAAFFEPTQNDVVECAFRTRDVAIARAEWRVAAPGMRDLFVNGARVSPTALPPLTPYRKRILEESFDVTAHVRKGTDNLLRVELGNGWYNPLPLKMWYVYNLRDHLAIGTPCVKATLEIAYADGVRETVATDGSWRAEQGRIVHNSIYLGVVEDRRLAMDVGGKARVVKGPPGRVVAAGAFPKTVIYDRWTAQRVTQLSNDVWLVDMGVNAAGTLRATLRGVPRGGKVRLRQGERVWPDGTVNVMTAVAGQIKDPKRGPLFAIAEQRDSVIGDGSPEFTFEPRFTFHVFRYVQVEGPCAAPKPEDFEMCAWSADVKERSHFTCSNEKLNRLHEVCRRTFRANLQSVQSDCPGREKFGYGGDIACTADAFWLNYDMAEFYRKTLLDFLDEAEDDGLFTETAPFVGIASKSIYPAARQTPNAMIAEEGTRAGSIGWAVCVPVLVDSLVRYDGDLDSARLAYPALVRYIDLVAKRYPSNDIPECLGDHVAVVGEQRYWKLTSLAHWRQFVTLTAKFARLLGKTDDAARLRELAGRIAAKFRADYVHDGGKVGSGLQGEQLFALYHGLLEPKDVPAAYELLKKDIHAQGDALTTGIFGTKYLLEYLPLHGDAALAARVAMHEGFPGWFNMLDCGATTLWQQWSAEKCKSVSSNCHPMFGSVDEWLIRHVLGISVSDDAVGCDKVRIAPQPIPGVTSASGWLDTPKGRLSVSWKLVDGKVDVTSDIPDGIKIE